MSGLTDEAAIDVQIPRPADVREIEMRPRNPSTTRAHCRIVRELERPRCGRLISIIVEAAQDDANLLMFDEFVHIADAGVADYRETGG